MYRLATRVTVFRDSQYIGTWNVDEISNEVLISKWSDVKFLKFILSKKLKEEKKFSELRDYQRQGTTKMFLSLHKGEILCYDRTCCAGRTEVCQGIMGIERPDKGKVILEGKTLSIRHPSDAMKAGIGYLPEDRQKQGLILDWGLGQT